MSARTKLQLRVVGAVVGVLFAASIGILSTAEPASPVDATAGPIAVSVNPTSGLTDGQVVSIHAQAAPGSDLYEIRTHLCRPGAVIENTVDFDFDGPNCSPTPVSTNADYETIVTIPAGTGGTGDATFRVGVGSGAPWGDMFGGNHTLTCGPDAPCSLVVQLQVPNTTVFSVVPLCFGNCPVAPAVAPPPGASADGDTPGAAPAAGQTGAGQTGAGQTGATGSGTGAPATPTAPPSGAGSSRGATHPEVASARAHGAAAGGGDDLVATVIGSPIAHRAARVFAGGVAGVVGGCLIAAIIIRARRRMAESGIA